MLAVWLLVLVLLLLLLLLATRCKMGSRHASAMSHEPRRSMSLEP